MFLRHLPGIAMCAALLLQTAVAQQATQAVQAQQQAAIGQDVQGGVVNTSAISSESFAPASEADSDIGEQVLLQSAPKYQPFSAWTNWNVFWTSNAQLLNDTQGSDTFLSGALGGGYTPVIAGNLFFDASAEQSIFRYARNGSLDFNSLELNAGLIYVVRPLGDLAVYGHYTYDLLTARGFNKEIYADHTLSVGARKVFTLTRAHLFYASTGASFSLGGEPSYALRDEFSILGGYQLSLTRNMKLDLYYRFAVQPYTQTSRTDLNQLIGGGVSFSVTKWLTVQAISTIGINNSTNSTYSYFAANLGGGVGILVNF